MRKVDEQPSQYRRLFLAFQICCIILKSVSCNKVPTEDLIRKYDLYDADDEIEENKIYRPQAFNSDSNPTRQEKFEQRNAEIRRLVNPVSKDLSNTEATNPTNDDGLRKEWKQMRGKLERLFWQKLTNAVRKAAKQNKKEGFRYQRLNEFQRLSRHYVASPSRAVLQSRTPQFSNNIDRGTQQRLWNDVMAAAKKKTFGNVRASDDQDNAEFSGTREYATKDPWITMMANDEATRINSPYQYAYKLPWPKYPLSFQLPLDQVTTSKTKTYPEHAKKFQLNHHYRSK